MVDRILRLKDEQDALTADIKEVYAEAVSHGYVKSRLGEVITILRKRAKDPAAFEERNSIVESYLAEIGDDADVYAKTGTRVAPHAGARDVQDSSGESRERQRPVRIASPPVSKPEAPPMDAPRKGPSGTAATDDEDVPDYLRRGHPDNAWVRQ
jgi:uncharacterized protein (UPF0335 family)